LVLRLRTVTTTENKIVLAKDDIYGSCEFRRWGDNRAKCKELAEGLGLLIGGLYGKYLNCGQPRI